MPFIAAQEFCKCCDWDFVLWCYGVRTLLLFNNEMIFKQTEEDDFQWEENDELIRTGCVLVGPSLMRLAMTLTCVTHSNWFVCTSLKWMLLNIWMVKMSLLCPDCCWESGRWQSSGRNIYHHLATPTTTTSSSPPGNSKRIRPISQKQVLPCLTISCHGNLFLRLRNSITTAIIDIAGNQPSCSGCYLRALGEHDDML